MAATNAAIDPAWLTNARQLVGLKEIVGSRHEPKVLEFFKEAGHPEIHNDETAWCAAFANAMLRRAGYAGTGALNARSFLNWGSKLDAPKLGCIAVFKRGNSEWEGHVAFFLRDLGDFIEVLGGNQGNAVSIARQPKSSLLGYRWPLITSVTKVVSVAVPTPIKPSVKADAGKVAGAAAATTAVVVGARSAADQGISALEICLWIGGLSAGAVAAFIIGYRIIKGHWPWTSISTGNQSPAPSLLLPQSSEPFSEQVSAALSVVSSAASPAMPSPASLVSIRRRKPSAKPSQKTRMPARKSSSSKPTGAKKSAPKRKSKSKR